ncbi:YdcF family protein [Sphingobacterium lactis]|uniref:DUF218 domain-containing protein n=1 Tax=Sphingobacterium lactis TaxID=797291 RepID=A0A1H5RXQ7_9SPHI|nr:YdcF family protein [Sphingobacterium lactis]SEF43010.1 DUF218 domain-containing protein [Sphingobacterium lactis]
MSTIIMVLGAPNDEYGNLSPIALDRLYKAYELADENETAQVLCTGGNGEHFNTTNRPHFYYAENFLKMKGIAPERFLPGIPSRNTMEDFCLAKASLEKIDPTVLILVTSDFHMERAKILCNKHLPTLRKLFIPAISSLNEAEMETLLAHERNALRFLRNHKK